MLTTQATSQSVNQSVSQSVSLSRSELHFIPRALDDPVRKMSTTMASLGRVPRMKHFLCIRADERRQRVILGQGSRMVCFELARWDVRLTSTCAAIKDEEGHRASE
jgi:hypothetical protein